MLELAVADAQAALALVRSRAGEWRIDPSACGIIGFSAGGGVAVGTALAPQSDASPDFLVSVYGPSLQDVKVPPHAPPLFVAVGATHFNVTNGCLALFAAWKAAGKPAGDSCLRRHQRGLRHDEARPPGRWMDGSST